MQQFELIKVNYQLLELQNIEFVEAENLPNLRDKSDIIVGDLEPSCNNRPGVYSYTPNQYIKISTSVSIRK